MAVKWTVSVAGGGAAALAVLKIEDLSIRSISRGMDVATVTAAPSVTWAYGTLIAAYYNGTRRFLGRVSRNRLIRAGKASYRAITIAGPQYWLNRIVFRQEWLTGVAILQAPTLSSRVILNQTSADEALSVDGQIQEIIAYAASRGAPIAFGSSAVGLTLPFDEQRDLSCMQALERVLRYTPDIASWIDYSVDPPAIHFGVNTELSYARVEADEVDWRDDLVVPGLQIEIERVGSADGVQYRTLEYHQAGDLDDVDAVFVSLPLAGAEWSQTVRTLDVVTEAVGDHTAAAWWAARHPRLENVAPADVTVNVASRGLSPELYPRISSAALPDLEAAGCVARLETFTATVDIITRKGGEVISTEYDIELEIKYVTTDATTKTYRWQEEFSADSAEPTPTGLATDLLAHWSVRYADGSVNVVLADVYPLPGQTVLGSPVQQVDVSSKFGSAAVTFGAPAHLSAQDLAARLAGFRDHRKSLRFKARESGSPASGDEQSADLISPVSTSDWAPGQFGRLDIADAGKTASLNPADLGTGGLAKFRTLSYVDGTGTPATAKILADGDVSISGEGGFEEREVRLYCGDEILDCIIKVKSNTLAEPTNLVSTAYTSDDSRLLLQVKPVEAESGYDYKLELDQGYLVGGA